MARKTYGHSDETYQAIVGHEAEIAKEMDCDPTYIYNIKNRKEPDRYPPFRELYKSTAYGGGDTSYWRNDMDAIDARVTKSQCETDPLKCLLSKIHTDSESTGNLVEFLKDGELDKAECQKLLADIKKIRDNANLLETYAQFRLGVLEDAEVNKGKKSFQVARNGNGGRHK